MDVGDRACRGSSPQFGVTHFHHPTNATSVHTIAQTTAVASHTHTHTHTAELPTLDATMIAATRRWVHSNRKRIAIGAGVIGAGYVAGQYVLGKISEARQRMGEDRIAKEK
jgi:hypothetical protein